MHAKSGGENGKGHNNSGQNSVYRRHLQHKLAHLDMTYWQTRTRAVTDRPVLLQKLDKPAGACLSVLYFRDVLFSLCRCRRATYSCAGASVGHHRHGLLPRTVMRRTVSSPAQMTFETSDHTTRGQRAPVAGGVAGVAAVGVARWWRKTGSKRQSARGVASPIPRLTIRQAKDDYIQ